MDTGNLTLRTNSIAREILVDPKTGKARGVVVHRLGDGTEPTKPARKSSCVAASTLESARLLLLSKSSAHPNGIGNSSGHVGHNFCEHVMGPGVTGLVKDRVGKPKTIDDGRPGGFYVPRFRNLSDKHPNFIRGYGFEGSAGSRMFPGQRARDARALAPRYKKTVRDYSGAFINMGGFGEVLPRYENQVALDPARKDKWGIPVLRFNYKFGDNEKKMCEDMANAAQEMFEQAGFEIVNVDRAVLTEGWSIHELGTARMGTRQEDVGAESVPAVARREEPLRRRRQQPRQRVVPEPDLDDHGAGLALVRLPGHRVQEGESVMADSDETDLEPTRADQARRGGDSCGVARRRPMSLAAQAAAAAASQTFFTPRRARAGRRVERDDHPDRRRIPPAPEPRRSPPTSTPGSPKPGTRQDRTDWRDGLKLIDQLSQESSGKPFMQSSADQRLGGPDPDGAEREGSRDSPKNCSSRS